MCLLRLALGLGPATPDDGIAHARCAHVGSHVVDAHGRDAGIGGPHDACEGTAQPVSHVPSGQASEERLARRAQQHGHIQLAHIEVVPFVIGLGAGVNQFGAQVNVVGIAPVVTVVALAVIDLAVIDGIETMGGQLGVQATGVIATVAFTAVMTWVILKVVQALVGLRVDEEQEIGGLDIALHEERGYDL